MADINLIYDKRDLRDQSRISILSLKEIHQNWECHYKYSSVCHLLFSAGKMILAGSNKANLDDRMMGKMVLALYSLGWLECVM